MSSEEELIEWITAINVEVKDLKFFANRLSQEFSSSVTLLITIRRLVIFVGEKAKCCQSVRDPCL
jgi:hypothetical protein